MESESLEEEIKEERMSPVRSQSPDIASGPPVIPGFDFISETEAAIDTAQSQTEAVAEIVSNLFAKEKKKAKPKAKAMPKPKGTKGSGTTGNKKGKLEDGMLIFIWFLEDSKMGGRG